MLDLAILGLLHEQELHGYEIRRRLRDELGLFANISFGSLYPALSRLEAAGAVAVTESAGAAAGRAPIPLDRVAEWRAGRAAGPPGRRRPGHQAIAQGLPDHRPRPRACSSSSSTPTSRPAPTTPGASGCAWPSPGTWRPRPGWPCSSAVGPSSTRRLATDRARAAGDSLDVYTRSLVEHSTEATEHDIAWLDRLIESETTEAGSTPIRERRSPRAGTP